MTEPSQPVTAVASRLRRDERGFTLIELLVAMVVSLVVLGGGVWGMARAFRASSASTARVTASSNAEVGLERLVIDLRDAVNPSLLPSGTSCAFNTTVLTGVSVALSGSVTTLQMCDPNTNKTAAANVPPPEGVQWLCNTAATGTAPETCIRSVDTGTASVPAVSTSSRIAGVQTLALKGVVNSVSPPVYLPCGTTGVCTATKSQTYVLTSGNTYSLSWVGLTAAIGQNANPGAGTTQTVAASSPLTFSTGAALLNFGTS